jgi:hypothetical protein
MILKEFFAEARKRRAEGREHQKGISGASEVVLPFDGP